VKAFTLLATKASLAFSKLFNKSNRQDGILQR
jgi:hypothetical protein